MSKETAAKAAKNDDNLRAAREAGNTWEFEGRELELYVARGEAQVATSIMEPGSDRDTGAMLVHRYRWEKADAFVEREDSFKTTLSRVGRRVEQKIDTTHLATANGKLYREIIAGGTIVSPPVNGESAREELTREQLITFSELYPEAASEAIETWLDASKVTSLDRVKGDFSFLFKTPDMINTLWYMGEREAPVAAVVFKFKTPSSEERAAYDDSVQKIETKRRGDVSSTDIEENFRKKISYGAKHLIGADGVAFGEEGKTFDGTNLERFILLFGPIQFSDVVDNMHSTFDFMKGRSRSS